MERKRNFLEQVKLQTIDRVRNEAVLALEAWAERDLDPRTRKEDFNATRRRLLYGMIGAAAVRPVLSYKEPPTSKLLEQGQFYEFKRQFYFFNETPGVNLRINSKNLKRLLLDQNIDIIQPQNAPLFSIFRPTRLNSEGEESFWRYFLQHRLSKSSYQRRPDLNPGLTVFLDEQIRDELKENPYLKFQVENLSQRLSVGWVKAALENAHAPYGQTPKPFPKLTPEQVQEIKNNPIIEVLAIESYFIDAVVKRYFVAPEVKMGPEMTLNQPQMILKEGNGASIRNGIVFSTTAGLEVTVLSSEASQLIREWENKGIAVPANSLVIAVLGPSNNHPDMNSVVLDDFRKNQLSKLLTRYNPDTPFTLKLIPVYEAINNVVGYQIITANNLNTPLDYSRLSAEFSLAWARVFYETAALAKGKHKEELELSPEEKRRVVELLPLRVIFVDQALSKKAVENAPKG